MFGLGKIITQFSKFVGPLQLSLFGFVPITQFSSLETQKIEFGWWKSNTSFYCFWIMNYELCGILVNFGKHVGPNSMSSPHQKSGANTLFLLFFSFFSFSSFLSFFFQFVRFSLLFYVFFLSSFLISFFLSPSPKFLCSQLFLFLFLDFSFFLSTPIWVVIYVYGFYLFLYSFI